MQGNTFERFEEKYLLSTPQYQALMAGLRGRMQPDLFGRSTVSSIYYDTPDYRLIRTSLDKPDYKEKLRVRVYGTPTAESKAFVELKKKVDGIVYKRRVEMPIAQAKSASFGKENRTGHADYAGITVLRPLLPAAAERVSFLSKSGVHRRG